MTHRVLSTTLATVALLGLSACGQTVEQRAVTGAVGTAVGQASKPK